jgi:hypothetical protein
MADYEAWQHGGATYPLPASIDKTLLEDVDPAIFHTLEYLATVLDAHIGARLAAQGIDVGLAFESAVLTKLHVEPSDYMGVEHARFPLLALYRKGETDAQQTLTYDSSLSEWEFAYVLPPLQPRQVTALNPILRGVARTVGHAINRGWDPFYKDGAKWWEEAGVTHARLASVRYVLYPPVDDVDGLYRAVVGTIRAVEREQYLRDASEPFGGGDISVDVKDADGTTLVGVAVAETHQPPAVTLVSPTSGTKAGGTTVTITGARFKAPARVRFGSAASVVANVIDDDTLTVVTPPHAASPIFIADVVIENGDAQSARVPAAFTFTTP